MRAGVVLPAAGEGRRFREEGGVRKQLLVLRGRPILWHSLDVFARIPAIEQIVVVGPARDTSRVEQVVEGWRAEVHPRAEVRVVPGGARRQDSVRRGIEALGDRVEVALVHDAARPLVQQADVERLLEAIVEEGAAVLGYPATDSIKRARGGRIEVSEDRSRIWQVQTPQGARLELFHRAWRQLDRGTSGRGASVPELTDEAALLETLGISVRLIEGSASNIKVTRPGDERLAEFLLAEREGPEAK